VVDVKIPTKVDGKGRTRMRGFGFVEFADRAAADKVRRRGD